jgi:hypothetical protein
MEIGARAMLRQDHLDSGQADQAMLGDILGIAQGHGLFPAQAETLIRFVTGAVRPNRDRPIWDLCCAITEIGDILRRQPQAGLQGGSIEETCHSILLGSSEPHRLLDERARTRSWACLMAFGDFLLTHQECAWFSSMRRVIASLCGAAPPSREAAIRAAVAEISERLRQFRRERLPFAQHERQFRAILGFLASRGRSTSALLEVTDEDIFDFWSGEVLENRMLFQTAVRHFLSVRAVAADLLAQQSLLEARSFDDDTLPGRQAELLLAAEESEGLAAPQLPEEGGLAKFLRDEVPEDVKILTGTERDRLLDLVDCGDFARTRTLTALRYMSFGAVQSGLINYLRRGGGGMDLHDRVSCDDAPKYSEILSAYTRISVHLDRVLCVAADLAITQGQTLPESDGFKPSREQTDALATVASRDMAKLRRKGFSENPERLRATLLPVSGQLTGLRRELAAFLAAVSALDRAGPLPARFEADRAKFSKFFATAYLDRPGAVES